MKTNLTIYCFFCALLSLTAQTASLSGRITDNASGIPLIGVTVILANATDTLGAAGDTEGRYNFIDIPPGRYDLTISYVGFYPLEVQGYLVGSGPATERNFSLVANPSLNLPNVVVRSSPIITNPLSREITLEQVRRLPATFYDPARLLALSPGVVQTNDQANHLSVRGNSPNANLWRIQGLAIVNPNHTANAGTITDLPTFSGGGVNAISAQLLDNSTFYAGGVPVEYGHATGGTFDLRLRPGNNQQRQHQVQVGLIGIDLATEGPIGSGPNAASYLANYRYSFTGLLGDLGVDFGGEEIRFQDFNFHLHQPLNNGGEISFFGIGGVSSNEFTAPTDPEEITEEKELFNIDFTSAFGVIGATYRQRIGRGELKAGAAYSTTTNERDQRVSEAANLDTDYSFTRDLKMNRISANVNYTYQLSPRASLLGGIEWLAESTENNSQYPVLSLDTDYQAAAVSPYLNYVYRADRWRYSAGLRFTHYNLPRNSDGIVEPRLAITHFRGKSSFTLGLEGTSSIPTYALFDFFSTRSQRVAVPVNYQANLSWKTVTARQLSMQATAYFQLTPNDYAIAIPGGIGSVPVGSTLSLPSLVGQVNDMSSRRYGLELSLEKPIRNDEWYYALNTSVFQSEYRLPGAEQDYQAGRYAQRFTTRLLLGKEWTGTDRKGRKRAYGSNLALLLNGGERQPELDLIGSEQDGLERDIYDYTNGFTVNTSTYFRPDLRLYKRKFRKKTTTTLALDIQNVAGINNSAYFYYDNFLRRVEERKQLTLIPVLSYRIEWR